MIQNSQTNDTKSEKNSLNQDKIERAAKHETKTNCKCVNNALSNLHHHSSNDCRNAMKLRTKMKPTPIANALKMLFPICIIILRNNCRKVTKL